MNEIELLFIVVNNLVLLLVAILIFIFLRIHLLHCEAEKRISKVKKSLEEVCIFLPFFLEKLPRKIKDQKEAKQIIALRRKFYVEQKSVFLEASEIKKHIFSLHKKSEQYPKLYADFYFRQGWERLFRALSSLEKDMTSFNSSVEKERKLRKIKLINFLSDLFKFSALEKV